MTHACSDQHCCDHSAEGWTARADACGAGCGGEACCGCSCGCGSDENCYGGDLIDTAQSVKKSLLKEKIKTRLEAKIGKHLDAVADVAVELFAGKWSKRKEQEAQAAAMTAKLDALMRGF